MGFCILIFDIIGFGCLVLSFGYVFFLVIDCYLVGMVIVFFGKKLRLNRFWNCGVRNFLGFIYLGCCDLNVFSVCEDLLYLVSCCIYLLWIIKVYCLILLDVVGLGVLFVLVMLMLIMFFLFLIDFVIILELFEELIFEVILVIFGLILLFVLVFFIVVSLGCVVNVVIFFKIFCWMMFLLYVFFGFSMIKCGGIRMFFLCLVLFCEYMCKIGIIMFCIIGFFKFFLLLLVKRDLIFCFFGFLVKVRFEGGVLSLWIMMILLLEMLLEIVVMLL